MDHYESMRYKKMTSPFLDNKNTKSRRPRVASLCDSTFMVHEWLSLHPHHFTREAKKKKSIRWCTQFDEKKIFVYVHGKEVGNQ